MGLTSPYEDNVNPGQLVEQGINYIMSIIRYRMEKMEYNVAFNYLLSAIEMTDDNKENYTVYKEYYESLETEKEKELFVKDIIENGVFIKEEPFWRNMNMFDLHEIFEAFDIKPYKCDGIEKEIIIGEIYYLRFYKYVSASLYQ